jgi:hypothetical protein
MRRLTAWVGLGCGLALLLFFYRAVLFQGEQFGFRDSAGYYYPLYQQVQTEWNAGRWPLWNPSENAGMPLMGDPTAAVLYPGKVIYAAFSTAWAARLYVVAHSVLAFAGMLVLLRSWGTSWVGSMIAGLAYTFGGPVVFQYCNIIYLVGAAWIPWGFLAIDRWLRLGRVRALAGLAVVLAMQVLGGDPESAYVTGLCAGGYAVGLAWANRQGPRRPGTRVWVTLVAVGLVSWVAITLILAAYLPGFRPESAEKPWGQISKWLTSGKMPVFRPQAYPGMVPSLPWVSWLPLAAAGFWGLVGLILVIRWWRRGSSTAPMVPKLAGLVAAAVLAGALSAAQMVPAIEFMGLSDRATVESSHDIYPFSLEPYRLVEFVWPGFFGRRFGKPVLWVEFLFPSLTHRVWDPSLYLGGLTAILAIGAAGFRGGPPWRGWLSGVVVVSLLGSFGEFASPLSLARFVPSMTTMVGPHDPLNSPAIRRDGYLRDGDGSPYFAMSELLPGFQQFRYPSKLLSFTALAIAALAGLGWDRAVGSRSKRAAWLALVGSGMTLALLVAVLANRGRIGALFEELKDLTHFGMLDAPGALLDLELALLQGTIVLAVTGGLLILARQRTNLAGVLALLVLTLDLGLVNPWLIKTVPQSDLEMTPRIVQAIAEAERRDPSPGPFRVHRMQVWTPSQWKAVASDDRARDFIPWEHETLLPKYGLLHGLDYTRSIGVADLYDYTYFFAPLLRPATREAAQVLQINPNDPIEVYPRRGFDLWNSRYFILPGLPHWNSINRGIATFMLQTERIYPPPEVFFGKPDDPKVQNWREFEDVQVLRNMTAFPRAWIVHRARFKPPIRGLTRSPRIEPMEEILYPGDLFWQDSSKTLHDPRQIAWIEVDDKVSLNAYLPGSPPLPDDSVTVVSSESNPQRVVLDANLARPGLIILADVFYPGWKLTIDGEPSTILRANRLMRGAAVKAGKHRLVYTYEPLSFQVGGIVSLGAMVVLGFVLVWSFRRESAR